MPNRAAVRGGEDQGVRAGRGATGRSLGHRGGYIVKQRLGHEDIRTTANIYGHLVPAADGALAARLAEMFYEAQQPDIVVARPRG